MESLPPTWLRPLRRTENLHAIAISSITDVHFDNVSQQLTAEVHDLNGDTASLMHPFHARGLNGFNDLMSALENRGGQVRFVCGHVQCTDQSIRISPASIVFENDGTRTAVNPWIANLTEDSIAPQEMRDADRAETSSPELHATAVSEFVESFQVELADVMVTGLRQAIPERWEQLVRKAHHLGFTRMAAEIDTLKQSLTARSNQLRWNAQSHAREAIELLMMSRILD